MSTCIVCGGPIPKTASKMAKMCSVKCKKERSEEHSGYPKSYLPTMTTGAIGELLVSADLLQKGIEVFRSLSPNSSCDLITFKDGKLIRIEVTTGRIYKATGALTHPSKMKHKHDVLAVVVGKRIIYKPEGIVD